MEQNEKPAHLFDMSLKDAAETLNISRSTVVRLIARDLIRGHVTHSPGGRATWVVSRMDVLRLRREQEKSRTDRELGLK